MNNLDNKIAEKFQKMSLSFDDEYIDYAMRFAKIGSDGTKASGFALKTGYEAFIYSALIGINTGHRVSLQNRTRKVIQNYFSATWRNHLWYLFSLLISKEEIQKEIGLCDEKLNITPALFEENKINFSVIIDKLVDIVREFSNGGLLYIKEKLDDDDFDVGKYSCFHELYKETLPTEADSK